MTKRTLLLLIGVGLFLFILVGVIVLLRLRSVDDSSFALTQTQVSSESLSTTTTMISVQDLEMARKQQEADAPLFVDSDGDGLSDKGEGKYRTDIHKIDTDGDGFTDQEEAEFLKTDPLKSDSKESIKLLVDTMASSPFKDIFLSRHQEPIVPPSTASVMIEQPTNQSPVSQMTDSDQDGLTDVQENTIYKTDPQKRDTDGDTYPDADEIKNGYNPLGSGKCAAPTCIP